MTATGKALRRIFLHLATCLAPTTGHTSRLPVAAFAAALALPSALSISAQAATQLTIATEDYAPYHMITKHGEVTGFVTDKVREMLARAHVRGSIMLLPWKRAYLSALQNPDHCVFSTTRTAEREKLFEWVGPIAYSEWVFFALTENHITIPQLEDARDYTIGTYNGDARDAFLRGQGLKVDTALDDRLNLKKLLNGRIALWASDKYTVSRLIHQRRLDQRIVPAGTFNRVDLFLACHPGTPTAVMERLRRALAGMNQDGTTARLERRYQRWPS